MLIYNVTIVIDESVETDWLDWMKSIHIPDVMATGYFLDNKICKILAEAEGGISYAVQYTCNSQADLEEYQTQHAPRLQKEHSKRYDGQFASFRTLLEIVHQH